MTLTSLLTALDGKKSYLGLGLYALSSLDAFYHVLHPDAHLLLQNAALSLLGVGVAHKLEKARESLCDVRDAVFTAATIPPPPLLARAVPLLSGEPAQWPDGMTPPVLPPLDPSAPVVTAVGISDVQTGPAPSSDPHFDAIIASLQKGP